MVFSELMDRFVGRGDQDHRVHPGSCIVICNVNGNYTKAPIANQISPFCMLNTFSKNNLPQQSSVPQNPMRSMAIKKPNLQDASDDTICFL